MRPVGKRQPLAVAVWGWEGEVVTPHWSARKRMFGAGQLPFLPAGALVWPLVLSIIVTTDRMDRSHRSALRTVAVLLALLLPGVKGMDALQGVGVTDVLSCTYHH